LDSSDGRSARALEANDRLFGRPDPPFSRAPAFTESRRTARSRERRTHPRGVARILRGLGAERSALSVRRSRLAVSAATRSSLPHREPETVASDCASLDLARPFRARSPKDRRRSLSEPLARRPFDPLQLAPETLRSPRLASKLTDSTLPGFPPLQRFQSRGSGPRGLTSPATVRPQRFSRSRRLTPRDTFRPYFVPVTLLGFRLQGVAPLRGPDLSRGRCSLAVHSRVPPRREARRPETRSSELCSPRRVRSASGRKPSRDRCPPGVSPL